MGAGWWKQAPNPTRRRERTAKITDEMRADGKREDGRKTIGGASQKKDNKGKDKDGKKGKGKEKRQGVSIISTNQKLIQTI
jgi:hypothetical protein